MTTFALSPFLPFPNYKIQMSKFLNTKTITVFGVCFIIGISIIYAPIVTRKISKEIIVWKSEKIIKKSTEDYLILVGQIDGIHIKEEAIREEYSTKIDAVGALIDAKEHEKMCAQCRAYQARVNACNAGDSDMCNHAEVSAFELINTWYGEIRSICYGQDGSFGSCLPEGDYPGDGPLTQL